MKNFEQAQSRIKEAVDSYLAANHRNTHVPIDVMMNPEERAHVINIASNIMMNKMGYDTRPGSFVQAVLNNSLQDAVGCADHINVRMLPFYATMMYNLSVDLNDLKDE
jgi:hypothetical protein